DPLRPVDWRNRQAQSILDDRPRMGDEREDYDTQQLARFRRIRALCRGKRDLRMLRERMPHVFAAVEIHGQAAPAFLAGIEARILAGQTGAEIAELTGVPEDAIRLFEKLFFDVRDRLGARDFILNEVIPSGGQSGSDAQRFRDWKYFGYVGGPELLESVMHGSTPTDGPVRADDLAKGLSEGTELLARRSLAERINSSAPEDIRQVGQLHRICAKTGRADDETERPLTEYEESMAALSDGMPWQVVRPGISGDDYPEKIKWFQDRGIVLRASELSLYALTGELPNETLFATANFPGTAEQEPPNHPPEERGTQKRPPKKH
ncbi:MAG: hypothetical protein N2B05_00930, partial [Gemmatimonadales bacterium]